MKRSRALRSPVWQYFTKVGPIQAECSICQTVVSCKSGTTSAMFFHLQKRHPDVKVASPAPKLHPSMMSYTSLLDDDEGTGIEWKVELPDYEEYSPKYNDSKLVNKVKVGVRQTGVASLLDFLSSQYGTEGSLEPDVFIHCEDGKVPAHRFVLGAISPLLFSALSPHLEEGEDHVFVYGIKSEIVRDFLSWVYKGGTFPSECEELVDLLCVAPAYYPPLPLPKKIINKEEEIKEEIGEPALQVHEASDYEAQDNDEDEEDPDYKHKPSVIRANERSTRAVKIKEKDSDKLTKRLHTYFLDVQGDRRKLKCLLCDLVLDVDEENQGEAVFNHFQAHPDELQKIIWEKENSTATNGDEEEGIMPRRLKKTRKMKNKRSKVWLYFSLISTGLSECKMCHARMNMETGTTSSMIYHLKSKHEDIFAMHQFTREPGTYTPRKRLLEGTGGHRLPGGADVTDPATGMPIKIRLKRGPKRKKLKEMKTKRSKIWLFFTLKDDDQMAECNDCRIRILVEKGAVSKMIYHLRSEHKEAYEEFEEKIAGCKELCEICSERVAPGRLLHHNYANHYEVWSEDAKTKLSLLNNQLAVSGGGSLGRLISGYQVYSSSSSSPLSCVSCQELVPPDPHHMELHARTMHPELEVGPYLPPPAWLYYTWTEGEGGSCQLCLLKNLREADVLDHMRDKHPIDYEDLQTWAEAFREPPHELSFKTALLLERYEKRGLAGGEISEEAARRRPTFGKTEDAAFRTCMLCRKVFSSSSAMRYHIRVVHSALKPFTCHLCEKSFGRKDTLESHILSHSNIKPFMCSICGKQFKSVSLRNLHERRERGEKRFSCSFCQKKFANGQQKRNHERTHTGEKPYDCEHCGRMFAQKHQLVTHLRTHTGERPYSCNGCSQRFKHLSTRRNHKCAGGGPGGGGGGAERKPPGLPDSLQDRPEIYRATGLFPS